MDNRQLHHFWTRFRRVSPWYFVAVAIASGIVCAYALRSNNEHMAKLRDAVYTADKNDGDVTGALKALQVYVTNHMNTDLSSGNTSIYPPIQLKYTYDRLVQTESDQAAKANGQNSQIYTDAQHYCEAQIPTGFSGRYRVSCIEDYVKAHGIASPDLAPIPDSLYKFDFVSPWWSPDLAGWSLIVAILGAVIGIGLFVSDFLIKRRLR